MSLPPPTAASAQSAPPELMEEVFKRVGRNLLVFQQIERFMKALLGSSKLEVTLAGVSPATLDRQASLQKQTMGQLREKFFQDVLSDAGDIDSEPEPATEIRFCIRSRIQLSGGDEMQRYQQDFAAMIEQRNDLVHHFLGRWNLVTSESAEDAIAHLDRQREQVIPLRDSLKAWVETLYQGHREIAAFMTSEEGQKELDRFALQSSRLVALLIDAATASTLDGGWMSLSAAGHYLRREAPDHLSNLKSRYGHRTLKAVVIASELFDVEDEPTTRGGFRTRYRIKPAVVEAGARRAILDS